VTEVVLVPAVAVTVAGGVMPRQPVTESLCTLSPLDEVDFK